MWQEGWREELDKCRQELNKIDFEIIQLLGQRMQICEEIGEIKAEQGLPVSVPKREAEVVKSRQIWGKRYSFRDKFIRILFKLIMAESKRYQKEMVRM